MSLGQPHVGQGPRPGQGFRPLTPASAEPGVGRSGAWDGASQCWAARGSGQASAGCSLLPTGRALPPGVSGSTVPVPQEVSEVVRDRHRISEMGSLCGLGPLHAESPPGGTCCNQTGVGPAPLVKYTGVFQMVITVHFSLAEAKDVDQKD